MERKGYVLELTIEEMPAFLMCLRDDVIVNVTIDENGEDGDDRREEI